MIWVTLAATDTRGQTSEVQRPLHSFAEFPIGASVSIKKLKNDSVYRSFVEQQYNSITAENCMKMKQLRPSNGEYYWEDTDFLVDFCEKNGKRLHGHILVWHESVPMWLTSDVDSATLETVMRDHITQAVGRYKGKVKSWDVVNEVFEIGNGQYRNSI